jgi:hypothetical protein
LLHPRLLVGAANNNDAKKSPVERSGKRDSAGSTVGWIPRGGLVDRKQRSNIGPAVTAGPTEELRLEVGQPDVVRPLAGVDRDRMGAAKVLAIDQQPGRAGLPHFPESDFLFTHADPRHWSMAHQSAARSASASRYSLRARDGIDVMPFAFFENENGNRRVASVSH